MTTDETIRLARDKISSGEWKDGKKNEFFELVSDALAESLMNVADAYKLDLDVFNAFTSVCLTKH